MHLRRLARAVLQLEAEQLRGGRWRVTGGASAHIVDAKATVCDCAAAAYRPRVECSHRLRVLLAQGDAATLRALRELLPASKRRQRAGADQAAA